VTVPVTVDAIGPGAGGPNSGPALIGLSLHWQGHTRLNDEQPARHWYPAGALAWYRFYGDDPRFELRGNDDQPIVKHNNLDIELGATYVFKARSETVDGGVRYSFKAWRQGDAEPSEWQLVIVEDAGPASGAIALIAHQVDASFGDVTVTPVAPTPPAA
jgi:hypothetical protein